MVDAIHSVAASAGRDPEANAVGQARRDASSAKSAPPGKVAAAAHTAEDGDVSRVVEELNALAGRIAATRISFKVDSVTGESIVQVLDKETGDVIRQVPPKELLHLISNLKGATGLIFSEEI